MTEPRAMTKEDVGEFEVSYNKFAHDMFVILDARLAMPPESMESKAIDRVILFGEQLKSILARTGEK